MYEIIQSNKKEMNTAMNNLPYELKYDKNYKNYICKYAAYPFNYNEEECWKLNNLLIEEYKKGLELYKSDYKTMGYG